jgi:hypothetical protein
MGDTCTVLDGQYTLSNMKDEAMASGPSADMAGAPAPTEAPSSGGGAAGRGVSDVCGDGCGCFAALSQ